MNHINADPNSKIISTSQVMGLFIGKPALLPNSLTLSAINRNPVNKIFVNQSSIRGDQVANLIHHGGKNRVLHQYPFEHYEYWSKKYPAVNFIAGSMGENLSAIGLTEFNVCIGDIFQIGSVKCTVTEPRKPCATINKKFKTEGLAREVQNECKTGWFYHILEEGEISIADKIELLERPHPELTLEKCIRALLITPNSEILSLMVANPTLSENWKKPAQQILKTGILADDRNRLGET